MSDLKALQFNNVFSFAYQLYTSPWSQLSNLTFDNCTFNGIIVGGLASNALEFNKCTFNNYTNTISANNSNPTWIRPAYGNWTKGDNEVQGEDFKSLTSIKFTDNTVTSTRPVKFERIAQWDMDTTVTATGNHFDISKQDGDTSTKNVGMYLGANSKFDLVAGNNKKSGNTAALFTAVYQDANGKSQAGLPSGSTVKNTAGEDVTITDALEWKTDTALTLKTTGDEPAVATIGGVGYASLAEAIAAAKDGDTVKLLSDCSGNGIQVETNKFANEGLTVDFGGHTYTVGGVLVGSAGTGTNAFQLLKDNYIVFMNGTIAGVTENTKPAEDTPNWHGAPAIVIQNYANLTLKNMSVVGGDETVFTVSNNNGYVVIEDTVITAGKAKGYTSAPVAFDVCRYASYPAVTVTVKGNSVINGDIEVSGEIGDGQSRQLNIENGTFNGEFKVATTPANITISGGKFSTEISEDYCADGFIPTKNADGTYTVKSGSYVAKVGSAKYETLAEALAAAEDGDTVTLLADATYDVVIDKNITFDLGGKTLTNTSAGKATISVQNGATVTVTNGNVVGGTSYYNIEVVKGSNANLTLTGVTATAGNTGSSMIDNWGTLTITSGTYTGGLDTVKNEPPATLSISGGTFTLTKGTSGFTGVVLNYGALEISGGEFIQSDKSAPYGLAQVIHTDKDGSTMPSTVITGGIFKNLCSRTQAMAVRTTNAAAGATKISGGTFNKSVIESYWADGYMLVLNSDGTYSIKEGKYVAKIKDACYASLEEAVANVKANQTIKLFDDVQLSDKLTISKAITLDLNGHTVTNSYSGNDYSLSAEKTITIQNGTYKSTSASARGMAVWGKSTIKNLTIESAGLVGLAYSSKTLGTGYKHTADKLTVSAGYAIADFADNSDITITNSNITGRSCGLYHNGSYYGLKLKITDSTIVGGSGIPAESNYDMTGIYISGSSATVTKGGMQNVTLTNCVVNGGTGIEVKYTDLTLDSCTVTATSTKVEYVQNNNGAATHGFAVASTDNTRVENVTPKPEGTVTIIGDGKYTGPVGLASLASVMEKYSDLNDETISISGGAFTTAVPEDYCADGFIPTQNEDGSYGVKVGTYVAETGGIKYESLAEAINAAKSGKTVTMLANTRENVTISKNLILDLNGFTINGGQVNGKATIKVDNTTLTVEDSSEAKTGTIKREDTAENSGVSSYYVIDIQGKSGFLKFNGGNVINNSGTKTGEGASLVRLGDDKVAGAYPTLTINDGTFTQDNFIAIKVGRGTLHFKGGVITSANSYAIENWNNAYIKGGTVNGTVSSWAYSTGVAYSTLTISGGTVNGNVASVNYDSAADKQARIYVKGGTVTGTLGTYTYANGLVPTDETAMATIEVTAGTFEKDPAKYVVEGSAVKTNVDGTFGVEKAYLAKVGDTSYYTMNEAFHAALDSGKTLYLLRDYTTGEVQNSGSKNLTIDLGGHTWTYTGTDTNCAAFEINYSDVTLTVMNGTVISNSMVGLIPSAMGGSTTYNNSALVFENVTMTANGHSGIETNGGNTNDNVTLINSTLNVPNGFGIYFPSSGTLTINNSVINAKTMGAQVCAGSLNIVGDKSAITVTGGPVEKTENDGAIEDGAAISVINRPGYKDLGKVKVEAGRFTAKTGNYAFKAYEWKDMTGSAFDNTNGTIAVSGGTFTTAVPEDYCADGFIPTQNADGTYGVKTGVYVAQNGNEKYVSLQAAIDAAKAGDTVTLIAGVDVTEQIVINKSITLDLSGYTIRNTADIWDKVNSLILIDDGANVTVTGNGTIAAKENDCYTFNVKGNSTLTIENGTFIGNVSVVQVESGNLVINGGNFSLLQKWNDSSMYLINCIDDAFASGDAKVAIKGGTFADFDPNVSPEKKVDGKTPSFVAEGVGVAKDESGNFVAVSDMAAQILDADGNSVKAYATLAEAFGNVETGYTVRLLKNITLTEQINIVKALNGLTLDGNGYTITCATTTDPMQSGGSALYFGNANDRLYCTGIKIKDLTMVGTARYAIFLCGGTSTEFTNVKISGNYYIAVNLYGTHGAVMTNCDISNNNTNKDMYVSAIWSNVSSANPLVLNNTKVSSIAINTYTTANKLEPKIFVNEGSVTEVHTFDDGTVSGNRKLCVSTSSTGEYTILIRDSDNTKWIPIPQYTVTTTVSPAGAGVLTGGGAYEEGTEVTITATANGGYEFLGWYKGSECVSQNAAYTFKASANADFVAMFRGTEKVKLSVNVGAGKVNYKYGDVEGRWSGPAIDQLYSKGTSFTITAVPNAGYKFLYWINAENKVVSEAPEYSFILGDKTGLTACYVEDTGSTEYAYVVFRDTITKDIHWSGDVKLTGGVGAVAVPSMPYYSGYTFAGWFDADGNEFEVNANGNISVTANAIIFAKYVADSELYTVTVDGAALETKYAYGSSVTVTADEMDADGKYFAGWYVGNTCVSMNATYSFIIKSDVVLTTMYLTEKPEPEAVVTITVSERTAVSGTNKVAVATNVAWSLPEGCKLAKAGILYTFNDAYADKLTAENIGDSNIYVSNPSTTAAEGNYGFTISMGPKSAAKNLYVRGYITYVDAAGNIETLYTGASVKSPAGN